MSYAPPVISGGGATAGAGPAGSEFVAPAAAFAGQGFLAPGPAGGGADPGATAPVPTQANIILPAQPQAPAAPMPPPEPHGGGSSFSAPAPAPPAAAAPQQGISPVLRRKALLVACNYQGTPAALKGCGNDQQCMRHCLMSRFGFRDEEILMLFDGQNASQRWPTRANILAAMKWLVADARPGDSLFFHYSGHGAQTQDWSGDEADGYNEVSEDVIFFLSLFFFPFSHSLSLSLRVSCLLIQIKTNQNKSNQNKTKPILFKSKQTRRQQRRQKKNTRPSAPATSATAAG